jgi:ATP-binding cassette subfamily B protein/subfamily B ATP-binding cassette protein MsbA
MGKNFLRALRFCWPYRYRLAISIACAFAAAFFWGVNFTAIYPVLKILGNEQNLQDWVNERIDDVQKRIEGDPAKGNEGLAPRADRITKESKQVEDWKDADLKERKQRELTGSLARVQTQLQEATTQLWRWQLLKKYIDEYFPTDRFQTLALIIGLVVLAVAIKGVFEFGQETLVGSVVNLSLFDMRNRFYRHVLHLDVNSFDEQGGSSQLMAKFTNDMELLGLGKKTLFGKVIAEPLRAVACVVIGLWISWQLTLMFLILVPIAAFVLTKVGRWMKRATRRLLERMGSIYKLLQESFQGIRVVKAFTMEPYERRRFRTATRDYYRKAMQVVNLDAAASPIVEIMGVVAVALAFLAGAYLVMTKHRHLLGMQMVTQPLDAESLLNLYLLLAAIADPVRKLSSVYTRIQSGVAAADRIFEFADKQPRVRQNSDGVRLLPHRQTLEFRNVCFSYEPGKPILANIDLSVRFGETIAVVGANGSGKTTLLGLVPRFYDADHGSILLDGHDIRHAHLRSLRRQIGIVTQDPVLFADTIYNNIAYGNKRATREQVEEAARKAFAHDFILEKEGGYDFLLGEGGFGISGGQKQRVALARAILRDPAILILDEFNSQYDPESEAKIQKALREFRQNRTTFVITHRLNTLELADRIVVLDTGRIVAVGTHAELLATCPTYQRLHEAQFQRLCA